MQILTTKTKFLIKTNEPVRCKLAVKNKIIEQTNSISYLVTKISANQNRIDEVKQQTITVSRI